VIHFHTFLLLLVPISAAAQKTDDLFSIRLGASSANIIFNEAVESSIGLFGFLFSTGNTFAASGGELGISKNLNERMFLESSFALFSGSDTKTKVNNTEDYYTMRGYQVPLMFNYLFRDSTKRLRIVAGGGVQFLKAHLKQYQKTLTATGPITNQLTDINIKELQFVLAPGVQFMIISRLYVSFIVNVGISTNGRYSDRPCFSLKYSFRR
jgi:hypothetical protein